nr:hypothetical protein [Ktedonobacterales bacterium]
MGTTIVMEMNRPIASAALCGLREAVGWARQDADYPGAFAGYWATVSGHEASGELVAWCAILSEGVRHAVLL